MEHSDRLSLQGLGTQGFLCDGDGGYPTSGSTGPFSPHHLTVEKPQLLGFLRRSTRSNLQSVILTTSPWDFINLLFRASQTHVFQTRTSFRLPPSTALRPAWLSTPRRPPIFPASWPLATAPSCKESWKRTSLGASLPHATWHFRFWDEASPPAHPRTPSQPPAHSLPRMSRPRTTAAP